jgi:hypothetical protein
VPISGPPCPGIPTGMTAPPMRKTGTVDAAYYEQLAGELRGLRIRLGDLLAPTDADLISEFIDHNELGLALEQIADLLSEDSTPIHVAERSDMLSLARRMGVEARVEAALRLCPDRP